MKIFMNVLKDIHGHLRMKSTDFGGSLTLDLATTLGQMWLTFHLFWSEMQVL